MLRYESYSAALACDNVLISFLFLNLTIKKERPKFYLPQHYVSF